MSYLASALADAERSIDRCRKAPRSGGFSLNGFGGQGMSAARSRDQMDKVRDWVYSAIRPIASRIAGQPVRVGYMRKQPIKSRNPNKLLVPSYWRKQADQIEVLENHEILEAMQHPNDVQVAWNLWWNVVVSLKATGKALLWFRQGEQGLEVWQLPVNWAKPIHGQHYFERWEVSIPGGSQETLEGPEVAYLAYGDPSHPLATLGPLQANAKAIDTDESLQLAQAFSFKNGILPTMALVMGDVEQIGQKMGKPLLDGAAREQLRHAVRAMYAGVQHAGEPLILDALISDVRPLMTNPKEMDFAHSGEITKNRIHQGFGTNPIIAGQVEGSTRAGSAVADEHFCQNVVNPDIELISQCLTKWAQQVYGPEICVWIEPAVPHDTERRDMKLNFGLTTGCLTIDQWLGESLGLPPLENGAGNVRLMPFSLIPVPANETVIPEPQEPEEEPEEEEEEEEEEPEEEVDETDEDAEEETEEEPEKRAKGAKARRQQYAQAFHRQLDQLEATTAADLAKFLTDQTKRIVAEINRTYREGPTDANSLARQVFDERKFADQLSARVMPHLIRAAVSGAVLERAGVKRFELLDTLGERFNLSDAVRSVIDKTLNRVFNAGYWSDVSKRVREKLSGAIQGGIETGGSQRDIVRSVESILGANAREQAERIARTELNGAMNAGGASQREELIQEGLVTGTEWLSMGDSRVRDTHIALDGVVAPPGQDFNVGGYMAPHPGHYSLPAEERVNCRCVAISAGTFADE